jgi:hypothetical protein
MAPVQNFPLLFSLTVTSTTKKTTGGGRSTTYSAERFPLSGYTINDKQLYTETGKMKTY